MNPSICIYIYVVIHGVYYTLRVCRDLFASIYAVRVRAFYFQTLNPQPYIDMSLKSYLTFPVHFPFFRLIFHYSMVLL